jgi:C-methyltransferase
MNTNYDEVPPIAVMIDLMDGFIRTQIIAVAANLGVADALDRGPLRVDQIAESIGADPTALGRIMRTLASIGVFSENDQGEYEQNALSETLRTGVPGSLNAFAALYGQDWYRLPWTKLTDY